MKRAYVIKPETMLKRIENAKALVKVAEERVEKRKERLAREERCAQKRIERVNALVKLAKEKVEKQKKKLEMVERCSKKRIERINALVKSAKEKVEMRKEDLESYEERLEGARCILKRYEDKAAMMNEE